MYTYWQSLWDHFPFKSFTGVILLWVGRQAGMFMVFMFLVFMDCFTRWMAISYGRLSAKKANSPSLMDAILSIPAARREGLITSRVMKKQGVEKLILYHLCVLTAAGADYLLSLSGSYPFLSGAVVSYLAVTEALSIVENLSDAGVDGLEKLAQQVRKRM